MSSARLSTDSLQKFKKILSVYREQTSQKKWSSGDEGVKRLNAIQETLNQFELSEDGIDQTAFLKTMSAIAYKAYSDSWTKSSEGLSAKIMKFIAEELKMEKKQYGKLYVLAYATPQTVLVPETDSNFFARVNARANPTSAAVSQFLAKTDNSSLRIYTGIPYAAKQAVKKADNEQELKTYSSTRSSPM